LWSVRIKRESRQACKIRRENSIELGQVPVFLLDLRIKSYFQSPAVSTPETTAELVVAATMGTREAGPMVIPGLKGTSTPLMVSWLTDPSGL